MDQLQAPQDQQILQLQLQPLHQQMVVDLLNGLLINGVMMKITMLIVIGMEEHVVVTMLTAHIVPRVNVLALMKVEPLLPQLPLAQLQLPQPQALQLHKAQQLHHQVVIVVSL